MTIKELREHLAHYDDNMPVVIDDSDYGYCGIDISRYHPTNGQPMLVLKAD